MEQLVERFFAAIEDKRFEIIKEIFAENAKGLMPYAPDPFPKTTEGAEAIYQQFSGMMAAFVRVRLPRQIFTTQDPNFLFVKFTGDIDLPGGGKYVNEYISTFRLEDGKIVEYVEYFNPLVLAKTFGIPL